jgi:hypothetical protein
MRPYFFKAFTSNSLLTTANREPKMSDESLSNELAHAAKLDPKRRGELAELAFMRKAANLGFAVAKPWGDSDRYDVVVRFDKTFWRVQIKSVLNKSLARGHFRVQTVSAPGKMYGRGDIDFLVAYIFPEDLWYVFPAHVVEHKKSVCVSPGSKKSRLERYREKWDLMRLSGTGPEVTESNPAQPGAAEAVAANQASARAPDR